MRAWIFLFLCNLLWAGNYMSGKFAVQEISPFWVTFLRWLVAVAVLLPVAKYWEKPNWRAISRATWLRLAGMGLSGVIAFNIFLYSALQYTSPLNSALVSSLTPAIALVLTALLMRERISRLHVAGLVLALFGAIITLTQGRLDQLLAANFNRGDLLMIGSSISWVMYTMISRQVRHLPPITATALSSAIGLLLMLPVALLAPLDWRQVSPAGTASILYMALGASVLAFTFWNAAVHALGVNKASISINLIPIYTALLTLLLGQPFYPSQLWGGLFVISGLLLIARPAKKDPA